MALIESISSGSICLAGRFVPSFLCGAPTAQEVDLLLVQDPQGIGTQAQSFRGPGPAVHRRAAKAFGQQGVGPLELFHDPPEESRSHRPVRDQPGVVRHDFAVGAGEVGFHVHQHVAQERPAAVETFLQIAKCPGVVVAQIG